MNLEEKREERKKMLLQMKPEQMYDYVFKKKYTASEMDLYFDTIQTQQQFIKEINNVCNLQNKMIQDFFNAKHCEKDISEGEIRIKELKNKLDAISSEIKSREGEE